MVSLQQQLGLIRELLRTTVPVAGYTLLGSITALTMTQQVLTRPRLIVLQSVA